MSGPIVLVLAAGLGTRMKSSRAKVLHEVAGWPLIVWAVENARAAGASKVVAILGHQLEEVRRVLDDRFGEGVVEIAHQKEQKGTGHAVMCALPALEGEPDNRVVAIVSGDAPLLLPERLAELAKACDESASKMALVSTVADREVAYGHLVRDDDGLLTRIVEHGDASPDEKKIPEVNAGFYAISLGNLRADTQGLSSDNAQGELYLTDLAANAHARGGAAVIEAPFAEISGINNRVDLAAVERVAQARLREKYLVAGVTMVAPDTVTLDAEVEDIGGDTWLGPCVSLHGKTRVGKGVRIGQGCVLRDAVIEDNAVLEPYTVVEGGVVGEGSHLGPFASVGADSRLDADVRVGNFVEIRKSHVLAGASVGQLSYAGHATVGSGANLGAGTITCDYDGDVHNRTTIEAGAFVGSNSQLIAPVTVGRDAYVGAGTTVTKDVARGSLALSRMKQVSVEGWADRFREAKKKRASTQDDD